MQKNKAVIAQAQHIEEIFVEHYLTLFIYEISFDCFHQKHGSQKNPHEVFQPNFEHALNVSWYWIIVVYQIKKLHLTFEYY